MDTAINKKIRVLVVDDSAFMRKVIADILKDNNEIEVLDTARNGEEAIEKANKLKPDIITLDIEMPIMDGLTALPSLLKITPTPKVIVVSSLTYEGAEATIKALDLGALDFVTKPSATAYKFNIDDVKQQLIEKINDIAHSKIKLYPMIAADRREPIKKEIPEIRKKTESSIKGLKYIIAIGTSTGGPRALQDVIPLLPENLPAAVLIVQHMPPGFTKSLAARLDALSAINVKEAEEGDVLRNGWAYIAPGDFHMIINREGGDGYSISVNKKPPMSGHRPSVNPMMESVAESGHKEVIAVMMTGMGADGSESILKIKKAGGKTIAQNEDTCVVYGMPKAAVSIGAIDKIVPLQDIAKEILKYMGV